MGVLAYEEPIPDEDFLAGLVQETMFLDVRFVPILKAEMLIK